MLHRLLLPLLLLWKTGCSQGFLAAGFQDAGFQHVTNIFREIEDLMTKTQDATGKNLGELENPQNFNLLPPNYHNEQRLEHPIPNGTIYSHRRTDKVTDNKTGDVLFSQKTVSSIKQEYSSDAEPVKGCRNANDCEKEQYCQATVFTSKCRNCKAKETVCSRDNECCLGYLCVWGRCAEVTRGESGTICDSQKGDCAAGLCCTRHKFLLFPVCALPPTEGEECKGPYGSLLRMIAWGAPSISRKGYYCPCAEGLVCTNKGFNPFSTCEKSEEKSGFVDIEQAPFFQPIIRRDEELTDYDTDSLPWQLQDGQLTLVDLPQAVEDSENEAREAIKRLSEDMAGELEEGLPLDRSSMEDAVGPSQLEFQELKQLANQMGQYFGTGFY